MARVKAGVQPELFALKVQEPQTPIPGYYRIVHPTAGALARIEGSDGRGFIAEWTARPGSTHRVAMEFADEQHERAIASCWPAGLGITVERNDG